MARKYTPPQFSRPGAEQVKQYIDVQCSAVSRSEAEDAPIDHRFHVALKLNNNVEYQIEVDNPVSKADLARLMGRAISRKGDIVFGRDQRAYRWNGARWESAHELCKKWDSAWANVFLTPAAEEATQQGTLYNAIYSNCSAFCETVAELKPFGDAPGIPVQDGVLVPDDEGNFSIAPADSANGNLHALRCTADEALNTELDPDGLLHWFLYSSLEDDQRYVTQQWLGAHLLQHIPGIDASNLEKVVIYIGPGGNGKSEVGRLIKALVSEEACASKSLDDLDEQTLEELDGKVAMIGNELEGKVGLKYLKMIASKDDLSVNPKYRQPYTFTPVCLPTQTANTLQAMIENSDAISQRLIVVPMMRRFRGTDDQVSNIAKKIEAAEFPALVAWAVKGAQILIRNGCKIDVPDSIKQKSAEVAHEGQQIDAFAEEFLEFGNFMVSRKELTNVYREWCDETGRKRKNWMNFVKDIQDYARRKGLRTVREKPKASPNEYYEVGPDKTRIQQRPPLLVGCRIAEGTANKNPFGIELDRDSTDYISEPGEGRQGGFDDPDFETAESA